MISPVVELMAKARGAGAADDTIAECVSTRIGGNDETDGSAMGRVFRELESGIGGA